MFYLDILLLTVSNQSETPIMAIAIWIVILLSVFFCRRMIGRTLFGLGFGLLMLFFIIFMVDNYTGHNLRDFFNLNFYDTTIENPKGVAEGVADKVTKGGKELNDNINRVGSELDNSLHIGREGDSNKVWTDTETSKEEPLSETETPSEEKEKTKEKETSDKKNSNDKSENYAIISYNDIDDILKNQLSSLDSSDKKLLKSISPTYKTTLKGNQITITNDEKELIKNNQIKITVND